MRGETTLLYAQIFWCTCINMGHLEVITGSMFSGKTEELVRRVRRAVIARQKVQAFKPAVDNRYDKERIVSHCGVAIDALPVPNGNAILELVDDDTAVVAIDEAQFFDQSVVLVVDRLADQGYRVIVAGLDQDFEGKPFGPMPILMAIAEEVTKVRAICSCCGQDASRTQRVVKEGSQVLVGGKEAYEARCRVCHKP